MKLPFVHPDTFVLDNTCMETPYGKSETVPDQALKIRDIMERSLRGQILPELQQNQLQYGDDQDHEMSDFDNLGDLSDIEESVSYLEGRIKEQKEALERQKEAQEREKSEKAKQSEADKDDA